MEKSETGGRVAPPHSGEADWSLIGSRIPKHTMDTLSQADLGEMPALGKTDVESIWMYAACDEFSSRAIAEAGVEILHIVSLSAAHSSPKL